jgi:hypothetical protein
MERDVGFMTLEGFNNKYNINVNFIDVHGLINTLPREWRQTILNLIYQRCWIRAFSGAVCLLLLMFAQTFLFSLSSLLLSILTDGGKSGTTL